MNRIHPNPPRRRRPGRAGRCPAGVHRRVPAAFALRVPPPGGDGGGARATQVHTIVTGGMPGWQITLIAVAAAVIAAAVAVILDRAWAARRHLTAPSA